MTNHDAIRAAAAAVAFPDVHGSRHGAYWPPVVGSKAALPPRDVADDRAWVPRANCRGMDPALFVLERGAGTDDVDNAKAVCAGCVVRSECLEYAIANRETQGIWGGMSPTERRLEIRRRGLADKALPPIEHGTARGYAMEKRQGLESCGPCLAAMRRYAAAKRAEQRKQKEDNQ